MCIKKFFLFVVCLFCVVYIVLTGICGKVRVFAFGILTGDFGDFGFVCPFKVGLFFHENGVCLAVVAQVAQFEEMQKVAFLSVATVI